jgi:hypothetical protein
VVVLRTFALCASLHESHGVMTVRMRAPAGEEER